MQDQELKEKLHKEYNCPIWRTREGDFVPLAIMSQRQMENTYRYLCRHRDSARMAYSMINDPFWGLNPDGMAIMAAEAEEDDFEENVLPLLNRWIAHFEIWFAKRGFPVPAKDVIKRLPRPVSIETVGLPGGGSAVIAQLPKPEGKE